ncbi:MAG: DUF4173 domain-containing protein [Pseudomonadota bacterium]
MATARRSFRVSVGFKVAVAAVLVGLADVLFFSHDLGSSVGAFALAWLIGTVLARPGMLRDRRAIIAVLAAMLMAGVMIDRPGLLSWGLFAMAMIVAAMSARVARGEPAWRWGQRFIVQGVVGAFGPLIGLRRFMRVRRVTRGLSVPGLIGIVALPLFGAVVFIGLFAGANPIISDALASITLPPISFETVVRMAFWGLVLVTVGATLRPRWRRKLVSLPSGGTGLIVGVNAASVTLSLAVFNLLFAVQNGLDLAFLWSGASLPEGMTLAEYAHRGAYPLIVTALLAGAFVLITLRPGSETATRPLVRGLVILWVTQNMLLVASSMLRTLDYIDAYALTRFRLGALIWMALVGLGLLLICWRLLRDRSAHWLINANLTALLLVLGAVSVVDLGAITAAWNVRHAREVDTTGAALDLCYLAQLGSAAVVSVAELEATTTDPHLKARAGAVRRSIQSWMGDRQDDWRGWIWRDERRLARIEALVGGAGSDQGETDCNGYLIPQAIPPAPPSPTYAPLTPATGG